MYGRCEVTQQKKIDLRKSKIKFLRFLKGAIVNKNKDNSHLEDACIKLLQFLCYLLHLRLMLSVRSGSWEHQCLCEWLNWVSRVCCLLSCCHPWRGVGCSCWEQESGCFHAAVWRAEQEEQTCRHTRQDLSLAWSAATLCWMSEHRVGGKIDLELHLKVEGALRYRMHTSLCLFILVLVLLSLHIYSEHHYFCWPDRLYLNLFHKYYLEIYTVVCGQ